MKKNYSTRLINFIKIFTQQKDTIRKQDSLCFYAEKRKRCGFEKWLQFELYLFFKVLEEEKKIKNVFIEKPATPNKLSSSKTHFQIDLVVTLKNAETLGLELKTRINVKGAIDAINKDIKKFTQTRKKWKSTANFAVVLCAELIDATRKSELIKEHSQNNNLNEFHIIEAGKYHYFIAEAKRKNSTQV